MSSSSTELEEMVASIARAAIRTEGCMQRHATAADAASHLSLAIEGLVGALRRRFRERSRGSLFHMLKTELSAVLEVMEPPGVAHMVVAAVLGSAALGTSLDSDGEALDESCSSDRTRVGEAAEGVLQAEVPGAAGAKARRRQRLAKNRLERKRVPSAAAAAATPLSLILLEALPPLAMSRSEDGKLTPVAEDVVRHGLRLLRAIFEGQLPWLRPRVVLRIVDIYGLEEGGAPIDRAAAAEAIKTQGAGANGRTTRWRKPIEEGGTLLQWPSSVWGCSPSDDGAATPSQDRRIDGVESTADATRMVCLAAEYLVRLWTDEPQEALRAVAFILAFPSAAAMAAGTAIAGDHSSTASSDTTNDPSMSHRLSPQRVVDSLIQTRQWAALRQLLRAAPFGKDAAAVHRTAAVQALLDSCYTPQAEALVAEFEMETEFPSVANATQRSTLRRLLKQRQWSLATDLCGENVALRKWLVFELAANIHAPEELPLHLARRFGLDSETKAKLTTVIEQRGIDDRILREQLDARGNHFFKIGIPDDCIHMVDDLEGIALARKLLVKSRNCSDEEEPWIVGLDAEWKPSRGGRTVETGMTRVSILQLATRTHVVLLDMLTLLQEGFAANETADLTPAEAAVDSLLGDLFAQAAASVALETRSIIVGFQFAGDLTRLAMSYPRLPCFHLGAPPLNMLDALECAALVYPDLRVNRKRTGLGAVIEMVFGASLDKTCQCSAWEDRPLSGPQRAYAALDAWCLVRLAEMVVEQLRRDSTSSVTTSSPSGRSLTVKQAWKRVLAITSPVEASVCSSTPAIEHDGIDDDGDVEQAKRGAIAYGRDGIVALGVSDVERAITSACGHHKKSSIDGLSHRQRQGQTLHEDPAQAEFYLSVGQRVYILHPDHASTSDTTARRSPAVVVAAPRDEPGMWLVCIGNDINTSENQAREWVHFNRLVRRKYSGSSPVILASDSAVCDRPQPLQSLVSTDRAVMRILNTRTLTASEAAEAIGVKPEQIGKSLAFLLHSEPLCVVLRGDDRVDRGQLATQLGLVSKKERRKLTIASRNECVEIWGYPPGSMPPFGHRKPIRTIVDARLANTDGQLAVGGGSAYALVQLDAAALLELTNGEVLPITKDFDNLSDVHGALSRRQPHAAAVGAGGGGEALRGRHGPLRGNVRSSVDTSGHRHLHDPMHHDLALVGSNPDNGGEIPQGQKRFVVSNEMFRLARWLRVIGIDAAGLPTGGGASGAALKDALSIAAHEGRILLTRDKKLASRKDCGASYFVSANSTEAQFKEVQAQFGLAFNDAAFMSRCAVCNSPGFNGPLSAVEIVKVTHGNTVPPGVLEDVAEFWECANASCGKIYWEGPKFSEAHTKFSGLFEPVKTSRQQPTPRNTGVDVHDAAGGITADMNSTQAAGGLTAALTPKARATVEAVARAKQAEAHTA